MSWSRLASWVGRGPAYQPLDPDLTAIAALPSASNKLPYATGAQAWALADFTTGMRNMLALPGTSGRYVYFGAADTPILGTTTAAGRSVMAGADAAAQRTSLGIGADRCGLARTVNQSYGTGVYTKTTFDAANSIERFDPTNMHDPAVNPTRITIATAGTYLVVGWSGSFGASAVGERILALLVNNTTTIADVREGANPGTVNDLSCSQIWAFAAGDYVELSLYQNSGGALTAMPTLSVIRLT